jgi:hypothetical protein
MRMFLRSNRGLRQAISEWEKLTLAELSLRSISAAISQREIPCEFISSSLSANIPRAKARICKSRRSYSRGWISWELFEGEAFGAVIFLTGTKKAGRFSEARQIRLEAGDVRRLQAFGAAGNFELNRLAFVQRFVSFRLNSGKMDENVLAGLALDESESLAGIEPLDCSLFSH